MAGKPRPPYGILAFLDPLLRRPPLIVKTHHSFCRPAQIGDDESDAREQLPPVPFHFGNHPAGTVPTLGLILKVHIPNIRSLRRSSNRTNRKRFNHFVQGVIGWKSDRIQKAFLFQILIDVWIGKGGIAPKVAVDLLAAITGDNRIKYVPPVLGAMHIALSEQNSLHVTKLVEA